MHIHSSVDTRRLIHICLAAAALLGCGVEDPTSITLESSQHALIKAPHQLSGVMNTSKTITDSIASQAIIKRDRLRTTEEPQHTQSPPHDGHHHIDPELEDEEGRTRSLRRGDEPEQNRETTSRRDFGCDSHAPQQHLARASHALDTQTTHNVLIIPVTYLDPAFASSRRAINYVRGPHYPPMLSSQALQSELFGLSDDEDEAGYGHVKAYLEALAEGQIEVNGTVTEWVRLNRLPPLSANKCGEELFVTAVYPEDHPEFDPSDPERTRYISPALEAALIEQGIQNIDSFDSLGLVTACHTDVMRGKAPSAATVKPYELFGKAVEFHFSSHPHDSDILEYWAFEGAMPVGNVSRNVIHEILHTWGISHATASLCDEDTFGTSSEGCSFSQYGNPFSVMGNPAGIFSLDMMDRIRVGLVDDSTMLNISQSGIYTLGGINDVDAQHRVAVINWFGTQMPRLALQFRTQTDYDSAIGDNWHESIKHGLTVHVNSSSAGNTTQPNEYPAPHWRMVDPRPNSHSESHFELLSVLTDELTDPYAQVSVEILNVTDNEIQFSVIFEEEDNLDQTAVVEMR